MNVDVLLRKLSSPHDDIGRTTCNAGQVPRSARVPTGVAIADIVDAKFRQLASQRDVEALRVVRHGGDFDAVLVPLDGGRRVTVEDGLELDSVALFDHHAGESVGEFRSDGLALDYFPRLDDFDRVSAGEQTGALFHRQHGLLAFLLFHLFHLLKSNLHNEPSKSTVSKASRTTALPPWPVVRQPEKPFAGLDA